MLAKLKASSTVSQHAFPDVDQGDSEEPEFMDFDAEMQSKIPENNWKLVCGKPKLNPLKEAAQTPLPGSWECQNQTLRAPDTTHITMAATKEGPISSTDKEGYQTKIETKTE